MLFLAGLLLGRGVVPALAGALPDGEIIRGTDKFEFVYRVTLPEIKEAARLWVPLAQSDAFQSVTIQGISTKSNRLQVKDRDWGNQVLVLMPTAEDGGKTIEVKYAVSRIEKSGYPAKEAESAQFLKPERLVPLNETFKSMAGKLTEGRTGAMEKARALYDHTRNSIKYDKTGTGWGRGDAMRACDAHAGNCTDFHSYFIALARSAGIPARFAVGFSIPADKDGGAIAGYHCWAEFLADGRWVPVDISEASKQPALADYYFGHHPANRFELTRGRDLVIEPSPASGPMNFLVYPLLEIGSKVVTTENEFSFRRLKP